MIMTEEQRKAAIERIKRAQRRWKNRSTTVRDRQTPSVRQKAPNKQVPSAQELADKTKKELYARARKLDIDGRSSMNKDELIDAIREEVAA